MLPVPRCGAWPQLPGCRLHPESMRDLFDITTIIFLVLAVFIFLRLRSVLGQRTGRERPPYDPYSARDVRGAPNANVVPLPGRTAADSSPQPTESQEQEPPERGKGIAKPGQAMAPGLEAMARGAK